MEILLGNAYQKGAIKPREALYGGMEIVLRDRWKNFLYFLGLTHAFKMLECKDEDSELV